ncbi:MAG: hypothetical protein ABWZ52_13830 [Acidimicrobiales bacterium]
MTTPDRPWDYSVRGRAEMTEAEVVALAEAVTASRVSLYYDSAAQELTLRGYTGGNEPWQAIGWVLGVLATVLPGNRFALVEALVQEGDTDEEVVEALRDMGLYDGPEGHGYEGTPR